MSSVLQGQKLVICFCDTTCLLYTSEPIPEEEAYDGYLQLENGVGMVRLLLNEVREELETMAGDDRRVHVSVASGELIQDYLKEIMAQIQHKFPGVQVDLYSIKNEFFGGKITVSGLLTGRDLKNQLLGRELGERLLLPCNMFRSGEEVFLDDITRQELSETLQVPIDIVQSSGADLVRSIIRTDPMNGGSYE